MYVSLERILFSLIDSLYTNINNKEGLPAVAEAFAKTEYKDINLD